VARGSSYLICAIVSVTRARGDLCQERARWVRCCIRDGGRPSEAGL